MAIYITQGNYTSDAIRGLMAKPEDRTEEVGKLVAAAGGKLLAYYNTFGEYDFMLIAQGPNERDAAASVLVAAATGTVTNLKTTLALTGADMKQSFGKAAAIAAKFRPAGK